MARFFGRFNPKSNTYRTGCGQRLVNIHPAERCEGEACVIHRPSRHGLRTCPTYWRQDRGIMERICEHGVGHPDPDSPWSDDSHQWVHGCCGCCQ